MVEIYTAVQPQSRIRLALPNEVEVDLEANRVRDAQQHRDTRLLHLDVVESERSRGGSRDPAILELCRSFPDCGPSHTMDSEVPRHLYWHRTGRRQRKRHPTNISWDQYDTRIRVCFEEPSAHEPIAPLLVAHIHARAH